MTRPTSTRSALLALLASPFLVLAAAAPSAAQSAEEVLNTALERYEQGIEGIDDYTVTQETMGFTTTDTFVKKEVDGHPVFVSADAASDTASGLPEGWGNPYSMIPELAARAEMTGTTEVDGHETWVIEVADMEGMNFGGMTPSEVEGEFTPRRMTFYLGTGDYLLRRMSLSGELAKEDGSTSPIDLDARFRDYRTVEGMPHPYRIQMHVEGITSGMSDEDMAQARRQLQQLRERMENMPEQQREMMEQMMGPQIEQLEEMVQSGAMDLTVNVKEIKVNQGVAAGS